MQNSKNLLLTASLVSVSAFLTGCFDDKNVGTHSFPGHKHDRELRTQALRNQILKLQQELAATKTHAVTADVSNLKEQLTLAQQTLNETLDQSKSLSAANKQLLENPLSQLAAFLPKLTTASNAIKALVSPSDIPTHYQQFEGALSNAAALISSHAEGAYDLQQTQLQSEFEAITDTSAITDATLTAMIAAAKAPIETALKAYNDSIETYKAATQGIVKYKNDLEEAKVAKLTALSTKLDSGIFTNAIRTGNRFNLHFYNSSSSKYDYAGYQRFISFNEQKKTIENSILQGNRAQTITHLLQSINRIPNKTANNKESDGISAPLIITKVQDKDQYIVDNGKGAETVTSMKYTPLVTGMEVTISAFNSADNTASASSNVIRDFVWMYSDDAMQNLSVYGQEVYILLENALKNDAVLSTFWTDTNPTASGGSLKLSSGFASLTPTDLSSGSSLRKARLEGGQFDSRGLSLNGTSGVAVNLDSPLYVQLKGSLDNSKSTETLTGTMAYRLGNTVVGATQAYANTGTGFGSDARQLESSIVASHSLGSVFIEGQLGAVSAGNVYFSDWSGMRSQVTLGMDTTFVSPFVQVTHRQLHRDAKHTLNETTAYVGLDMDIAGLKADTYSIDTRLLTKVGYGTKHWNLGSNDLGSVSGLQAAVEWSASLNLNSGVAFSTNLTLDASTGSAAGFTLSLDR